MPMVNGKKFPYNKKGKAAAKRAASRNKRKTKRRGSYDK